MGLKDALKNIDMFGHQVKLNFNWGGDTHKTLIGAILSIFVKSFILYIIVSNFLNMFLKS